MAKSRLFNVVNIHLKNAGRWRWRRIRETKLPESGLRICVVPSDG